jgi:Ca2+-binding EF-hand superfamily protein
VQLHIQRQQLREAFATIDTSGDGRLDLDELRLLLQTLGQEQTDAGLRDKIRKLVNADDDADDADEQLLDSIDFEQFADYMLAWQQEELEDVFNFFDDSGSGTISVAELSECIQALGE